MDEETNPFDDMVSNSLSEACPRARSLDCAITPVSSSYPRSPSRPLIDFVKNGWMTAGTNYGDSSSNTASLSCNYSASPWHALSIITASRLRRYLIVYIFLLCTCWVGWTKILSPHIRENGALVKALDVQNKNQAGSWFGSNSLPKFTDMIHLRTLDPSLVPGDQPLSENNPNRRRLVVVGDVHGCKDELESLLRKVSFNRHVGDHLIFTGDLISKGPQSVEVVDLARKYQASCVRGNHEDRVLLLRRELQTTNLDSPIGSERDDPVATDTNMVYDTLLQSNNKERVLARQLSDEQAGWLESCPVILKVGSIKDMGDVVVVHAGLVPGVDLENQDPSAVMTMRTIDLDTHFPSPSANGISWFKLFNKHQSRLASLGLPSPSDTHAWDSHPTTVIYGHDSARSLAIKKYTKGLDTGCVRGGKLSAMVLEEGGKNHIVQVPCTNYMN